MLLRFVTDRLDNDTAAPIGVFAVAYQLLEDDQIADYQRTQIRETLDGLLRTCRSPNGFNGQPNRTVKAKAFAGSRLMRTTVFATFGTWVIWSPTTMLLFAN